MYTEIFYTRNPDQVAQYTHDNMDQSEVSLKFMCAGLLLLWTLLFPGWWVQAQTTSRSLSLPQPDSSFLPWLAACLFFNSEGSRDISFTCVCPLRGRVSKFNKCLLELVKEVINTGAQRAPFASNVWHQEIRLFIIRTWLSSLSCEGSAGGLEGFYFCPSEAGFVLGFSSQDLEGWRRTLLIGSDVEAIRSERKVWFIEDTDIFLSFFYPCEVYKLERLNYLSNVIQGTKEYDFALVPSQTWAFKL